MSCCCRRRRRRRWNKPYPKGGGLWVLIKPLPGDKRPFITRLHERAFKGKV